MTVQQALDALTAKHGNRPALQVTVYWTATRRTVVTPEHAEPETLDALGNWVTDHA